MRSLVWFRDGTAPDVPEDVRRALTSGRGGVARSLKPAVAAGCRVATGGARTIDAMSGKLPIDRVREAMDAPRIYEEHREKLTRKNAALARAVDPAEGEREPLSPDAEEDDPSRDGPEHGGEQLS